MKELNWIEVSLKESTLGDQKLIIQNLVIIAYLRKTLK